MINNRNDIVFWRIIALLGFLLLLTKIVNEIFFSSFSELFFKVIENELLPHGFHFIINVISCIAFAFLLFKPKTFYLYTLFSFYFAGINAIDGSGFLGNSFLILGIIFAYRSGFLKNKGKIKIYSILNHFTSCSRIRSCVPSPQSIKKCLFRIITTCAVGCLPWLKSAELLPNMVISKLKNKVIRYWLLVNN